MDLNSPPAQVGFWRRLVDYSGAMKSAAAIAALILAAPATAPAQSVSPFCPPGATFVTTIDGQLLCTVPPAPCKSPQVQVCTSSLRCTCEAPANARPCTASITYPVGQPAAARLQPMEPWCDAAGAELAIGKALARMMGDLD